MDNNDFHETEDDAIERRQRGEWLVEIVDLKGGHVRGTHLTLNCLHKLNPDDRVLLDFGPHNQLEVESGGLFAKWLRYYTEHFCIDFLYSEDWRKIEKGKEDAAWEQFQRKFYFKAMFVKLSKYKKFGEKFVMKSLSKECEAYKILLMKMYGCETIAHGPYHISKENWSAFVHLQFSDEKKMDNSDHLHVEETKDVTEGRKRGKWVVKVIDSNGNVREEHFTPRDIWDMHQERVVLEFGPHNQPEGGSGGLFATWLGEYSKQFCIDSLCYEDWRKIEKGKRDAAWEHIKKSFYSDASNEKYKKFVMKSLSQKCKDYKIRLMKRCRRETREETIANGPDEIPEEKWSAFVNIQFSDEKKKVRDRNAKSRSYYKSPHTLGSKSIARKSKEILLQEKKRPSRAEMYLLSRKSQNSDKDFVSEEARDSSEKLKEKMTQNTGNTSENNITSATNDVFAQVFGAERPGRVRYVGLGPTPTTFFQNDTASTSTETEVIDLRNRVTYLENKLERLDELEALIASMKGTNG